MILLWFLLLISHVDSIYCNKPAKKYSPTVTISDGEIIGTVNQTIGDNKTYYAYRGIPYAKPPIGSLRFNAPVENDKWSNILYATNDKSICTQFPGVADKGNETDIIGSEDCLYINVYTTSLDSNLPVMVWIHGGGYIFGSSAYETYGPDFLIEKDVVFVSFNYRLGVFGFLSTEDLAAPGNWGMKDQVLALKWIIKNIAHFGGDPERVTIFGESAGGVSVSYLLQSNAAIGMASQGHLFLSRNGLFRAAIMQSGHSLIQWCVSDDNRERAFEIGANLGIVETDSKALIKKLQEVDYKRLKYIQSTVDAKKNQHERSLNGVVKEPEHNESFFSSSSYESLKNGNFNKVPIMIGFNSAELGAMVNLLRQSKAAIFTPDVTNLVPYSLSSREPKKIEAGTKIKTHFFGENNIKTASVDKISEFLTFDHFVRPTRKAVQFLAKYTNVYFYQFSYMGNLGFLNRSFEGVAHAEELSYLFNTNFEFYPRDKVANAADTSTRQKLVTLWTNFAKTLDPIPIDSPSDILGNVKWIPNTPSTDTDGTIKYLNINETLEMRENPWEKNWQFYQKIYNDYGDDNYLTY